MKGSYWQGLKRFWKTGMGLLGLILMGLPSSAQRQEPQLYGGGTYSPTQPVRLEYFLPEGGRSQIRLLKIQNPERVVELGGPRDFQRTRELSLSPVRTVPVFRARNNPYGNVTLGRLPEGLYLAQIGAPRPTSATLVLVTRLGLVVKSDPQSLLVYTASLSNGQPRTAQVFLSQNRRIVQQVRAEGGLAQLRSQLKSTDGLFVAARSGTSWAFSNAYWQSWNREQNRVYLVTDRPVYRPGHTVFFKGTARSASGLKPVAGQPVEAVVRDSDDAEVFSGRFTTDAYGSFSGQLRLGLDARLGAYTLVARLGGEEHSGEFEVQEFVKPEYRVEVTSEKKVAVQGEKARFLVKGEYLFGGPVAGGRVSYALIQRPYYRFAYTSSYGFYQNYELEDSYEGKIIERGEGRLNAQGELVVELPLKPEAEDYRLTLEAGVSDEAGREISGTGFITAYRAGVVLDIRTDQYAYQTQDTLIATVRAQDLEGNPVSLPFSLTASRAYWVRGQGEQRERTLRLQGRTDARGEATLRLRLPRQGAYALVVEARDGAGRATQAEEQVWVSDGSYWFWGYKSLKITPDKPEYRPGETARFVVQSPVADGWALVNLEGERLARPEIVRFRGSTFTYALKLTPEMAPNGYLSVTVLGGGEYYTEVAGFLLPPSEKFLNVAVASDKATYKPGETATYRLKVTDAQGRPVKSQVTLGLVDEAIYLVRPEKAPDIRAFFWALKNNLVGTQTAGGYYFGNVAPAPSTAARAPLDKAVFGQAKDSAALPRVREDFRDTILWLPSVETGEQGEATLEARFPDNLTQWRLTARAITLSDSVGQATQTVTTTLPVIARLSAPRFLVRGDEATLRVIGQNNLSENQAGQLRLEATGLSLLTPPTTLAQLPTGGRTAAGYRVRADQSGTATLQASALTPAASDALRTQLPIFPKGLKQELGWASQSGDSWRFTLPPNTDLVQTRGKLYLTPSLAAAVTPALGYLAGYPYGCSEQTMSRFLPSLLAKQAGALARLPQEVAANLDDFVAAGLKRLYD
ncbi:MAG: MG2 domain-containing protein, partial [Meiothermus sp.]|uniref:alpha-2-macroglobulin family protein n=1 Tax=Meiothermus sp. TaxID=1955249 RepID=UPI00298F0644